MNNKLKVLARCALFAALGSLMYVGGCGPLDQNDDSLNQSAKDEVAEPSKEDEVTTMPVKDDGKMHALPVMDEQPVTTQPVAKEPADEEPAAEEPATEEPGAEEPAPMPAERPMIRPATPVVSGPTTVVRLPSRLVVKPTNVVNTAGMDTYDQRTILYKNRINVLEPTQIVNPLRRHHNTTELYKTKIVRYPVQSTVVPVSDNYTANRGVLPTEVEVRPVRQIAAETYAPPVVQPVAYPVAYRQAYPLFNYFGYGYGYGARRFIHPWYRRFWL